MHGYIYIYIYNMHDVMMPIPVQMYQFTSIAMPALNVSIFCQIYQRTAGNSGFIQIYLSENSTMLREAGVSRHHGRLLWNPSNITALLYRSIQGGAFRWPPIMPRGSSTDLNVCKLTSRARLPIQTIYHNSLFSFTIYLFFITIYRMLYIWNWNLAFGTAIFNI